MSYKSNVDDALCVFDWNMEDHKKEYLNVIYGLISSMEYCGLN